MNADPNPAKAIFLEAVERHAPDHWPAFLDRACAGRPDLRGRVEALLAAHREIGTAGHGDGAEGASPVATAKERPAREGPGTVIGPYKLLEQIGEGGFGVVFVAEQAQPVRRRVALKMLKAGMDTRQVVARFEAERQALALMDHPNIAQIHDGGTTPDGRPFFVMELVKGIPLTDYCDRCSLTTRERLQLFLSVCQAVQHAHQKGVIHRDLKPSNVLVASHDGTPVAKVIDFGIAKAVNQRLSEHTLATGFHQLVGTPLYMSPEQAELSPLDVDTRADIYALGVLLYELLTGTTPLEKGRLSKAGYDELRRLIREEEPPRPSARLSTLQDRLTAVAAQRRTDPRQLLRTVRGELDLIVMKALEKDRNRRYESASALARDLERYLHDEPVLACPPSAGYRLRKFVRRNRGPALAASFVLLALVAGVIGTTWGLVRAREAVAAEKQAKETAELREAETGAVLHFVEEKVFAAARPKGDWGGLGPAVKLREAIEAALPFVDRNFRDQPLIEARLRMTIGRSFLELGDAKAAAKQFEAARAIYTQHLGPEHRLTLKSTMNLGTAYRVAGRTQEAIRLQEDAFRLMKAVLGHDDPDTLSGANDLASSYYRAGRTAEATRLYEETLQLDKARLGPDHPWVDVVMMNLANAYSAAGRLQEALALREETLARMQATFGPEHAMTLRCKNNLGNSYRDAGLTQEAIKLLEEVLPLRKATFGPDHPNTLQCLVNLARSYVRAGRRREATKLLEEALPPGKAKLGAGHREVLRGAFHLAHCYSLAGRTREKTKLLEEALPLMKATFGPDDRMALQAMNNLGSSYQAAGLTQEARKLLEEALQRTKAAFGPDHPDTLVVMQNLASVYGQLGRIDEATRLCEETIALAKARLGPDALLTLRNQALLVLCYSAGRRLEEAVRRGEETLERMKAKLGANHPDTLQCMERLRLSYANAGRNQEARRLRDELRLRKARLGPGQPDTSHLMTNDLAGVPPATVQRDKVIALREETLAKLKRELGPDHAATVATMVLLARTYRDAGKLDKALPLLERVLERRTARRGPDDPATVTAMNNLAVTYGDARQFDKAIPLMERTVEKGRAARGPDHPQTLAQMYDLASYYGEAGKLASAERLSRELLGHRQKMDGLEYPNTAAVLAQLGFALLRQHKYAEAEPVLRECVALREKQAPDAWTTFSAKTLLGGALLAQKKYAEAEPLLVQGYEGLKRRQAQITPRVRTIRLAEAVERLVQLYDAVGRRDEAARWRKQLEAEKAGPTSNPKSK